MNGIKSSDYVINIISKVLLVLLGLLSSAFMTRYLSVELRGEYAFVNEIVTISSLVLDMGLFQSYSYFFIKYKNHDVYSAFLNMYTIQFIFNIVLASLIYFVAGRTETLLFICIQVPINVLIRQFNGTMAVENVRLKILVEFLCGVLKVVLFGIIYFMKDKIGINLGWVIFCILLINILSLIIFLLNKGKTPNLKKIDIQFSKEVIAYSWLPMISMLLLTFNYSVDVLFMKSLGTAEELSYYSVAVTIVNYVWLFPDAFKEVLISRVSRSENTNHIVHVLKYSIYSIVIVIVGFFILGKPFITLLYGELFLPAYSMTLVLCVGAFSMCFFKIINVVFLAEGKRIFFFIIFLISVVANMVLNYLTIPIYGMYGAGISSVVSYSVCGFSFLIKFLHDKKINIRHVFLFDSREIEELLKLLRKVHS